MSLKRANPIRETEPMPSIPGALHKLLHIFTAWLLRYYNVKCAFDERSKLVGAEDFRGSWFLQAWMKFWKAMKARPQRKVVVVAVAILVNSGKPNVLSRKMVFKYQQQAHTKEENITRMKGKVVKQFKNGL